MTNKPVRSVLRTSSAALATVAAAVALTALPAHAVRPNPGDDPVVSNVPAAVAAAPAERGIQPGPVAAGTGAGLLLGAGLSLAVLRVRRRGTQRGATA
jgi:hypothetical protein